ncbi:MAG: hypothetical protein ACRCWQ_01945 [Bacilli bacterium]
MNNLYAIHAKKRCGKDSVARFIDEALQGNAIICALADPIKMLLVTAMFDADCHRNIKEELGVIGSDIFDCPPGRDDFRELPIALTNSDVRRIFRCAITEMVHTYKYLLVHKNKYIAKMEERVSKQEGRWSIRELMTAFGTDICVAAHSQTWIQVFYNETYCYYHNTNIIVPDIRQQNEYDFMKALKANMFIVHRPEFSDIEHEHSTEQGIVYDFNDKFINNNGTLEDLEKTVYGAVLL